MQPPDSSQRIRRWRLYLVVWAVHRALGLGLGALIVLASLTGGLLVMHQEIERLVERDRHVLPAETPGSRPDARAAIAPLVRTIAAEAPPGYRAFRLMLASEPRQTEKLLFLAPDGRTRWTAILNPCTGDVLWRGPDQSLLTPWLLALHMHLHLDGWGYAIMGIGGLALFLLGATGLVIHRDRLGVVWRRPMRLGRGWRVAMSDLHKWIGLGSIYFSIVLGLTGLIYTIKIAPGRIAAPTPLAPPFNPDRLAPVEPALAAARARFPGAELKRVAFPVIANAPLSILVLERDAPVWRKFSRMDFDPATGALRTVHDARDATLSGRLNGMLAPLHFGFYGSSVVKWLYVAGGFAPAILAVTGSAIWLLRRANTRSR